MCALGGGGEGRERRGERERRKEVSFFYKRVDRSSDNSGQQYSQVYVFISLLYYAASLSLSYEKSHYLPQKRPLGPSQMVLNSHTTLTGLPARKPEITTLMKTQPHPRTAVFCLIKSVPLYWGMNTVTTLSFWCWFTKFLFLLRLNEHLSVQNCSLACWFWKLVFWHVKSSDRSFQYFLQTQSQFYQMIEGRFKDWRNL